MVGGSFFAYGGTGLAFNPARGSLFMVGHDWHQMVAEVAVPAIRRGPQLADLDIAQVIQPFADPLEGRLPQVGPQTNKIGGLLPYRGTLYLSAYRYYDGDGNASLSHFASGLDLGASGDVRGPYALTYPPGFTAGYFGLVPPRWQAKLGGPVLTGQCCIPIISRSSFGPAVFTIDPTRLGTSNPLPAVPLVFYDQQHTLDGYDVQSTLFNASTSMGGVVFPEGSRSVLFFGRQGLGPYCYGEGVDCGDTAITAKGPHHFPYVYYVWAYDAQELGDVVSGQRQPWTVKPYAVWPLTLPFGVPNANIGGVAYDPVTGRIFLSEAHGDGDNPIIHVLSVKP